MLKFYSYLYKITGYCPAFLELRSYQYALRRITRLSEPGYYVSQPAEAMYQYIGSHQIRIGIYRTSIKSYLKAFVNYLGVLWKTIRNN